MESELEGIIRRLAKANWPWRIHATYNETIGHFLDVFERVHRDHPIDRLRWFIDHAETVSERNLERIQALGAGVAIRHRGLPGGSTASGVTDCRRFRPTSDPHHAEIGLLVGGGTTAPMWPAIILDACGGS